MVSFYMLEMTCLVFLIVSTDWSPYTLTLERKNSMESWERLTEIYFVVIGAVLLLWESSIQNMESIEDNNVLTFKNEIYILKRSC